ncbi:hypothetical protein HanIR_Chr05g0241561 [Helianthus annuus]|nr:hypothetical protein HanIR_Chr05g0241561 [Helianthus annuus]
MNLHVTLSLMKRKKEKWGRGSHGNLHTCDELGAWGWCPREATSHVALPPASSRTPHRKA